MLFSAALFAAGAVTAAIVLQRAEKPPRPLALEPLPRAALDLHDADTRRVLGSLARFARVQGKRAEDSLFYRCEPAQDDTYALLWLRPFQPGAYIEIRRGSNGRDATALYWSGEALLPPPPPPQDWRAASNPAPVPAPRKLPVSAADFTALEAEFLALAHKRVEAVRSVVGLDTSTIQLEFCRNGEYGVFAREGQFDGPDERRVKALAGCMAELVGMPEEQTQQHPATKVIELGCRDMGAETPPIPPPVAMPAHPSELWPTPEVWTRDVSVEEWNDVTQMAEALWRDGIPPVRYRPRREDGSVLLVEIYWRGRYGLVLRGDTNLADAGDARVIAFADRLFLPGGGRSHLDY